MAFMSVLLSCAVKRALRSRASKRLPHSTMDSSNELSESYKYRGSPGLIADLLRRPQFRLHYSFVASKISFYLFDVLWAFRNCDTRDREHLVFGDFVTELGACALPSLELRSWRAP